MIIGYIPKKEEPKAEVKKTEVKAEKETRKNGKTK